MNLVNMKLSAEEAKEYASCSPAVAGDGPRYPYGLCLSLDDDSLAKLGITSLPEVGQQMQVLASVIVTSVGMSQQQDGDKEQRCELQVTDMAISAPVRIIDAASMFPNSKMEK